MALISPTVTPMGSAMSVNRRLTVRGTARPVRVAYLVDLDACPDELLNAIFDEAYSRWGGRRTLIVPSKEEGIDDRYQQWLKLFDADVIYSYAKLNEAAVRSIHELFCPARLVYHNVQRFGHVNYNPDLPFSGLNSLSVIPALLEQSWGPFGKIVDLRVLDKFWDQGESQVLRENFGFISASFRNSAVAEAAPEYFKCTTLITQASLDNGRYRKDPHAEYMTDKLAILENMSKPNPLMTVSELSDTFCPFLQTNFSGDDPSLNLIIGDSVDDRLLFWNGHHRSGERVGRSLHSLRLGLAECNNDGLLLAFKHLIERRGRTHNGHHHVTIHSASVETEELDGIAEKLRGKDGWLSVRVAANQTHAACIPNFREDERHIGFVYGYRPAPQRITATSEFFGDRLNIPTAAPWHIGEARPPASIRNGRWMTDLYIERLHNHSKFSNVSHDWILPRRLRLQRAFQLEREDSHHEFSSKFIRVNRFGYPCVTANLEGEVGSISIPEDVNAFRTGLCNDYEWQAFDRDQKGSTGFNRFRYAEPSDKGRYLLAVLNHFESVPLAFDFLMNSFWRDVFVQLGAISPEKNDSLRDELIHTLKKRFKVTKNELVMSDEDHWDKLARIAIQFGRKVQKEQRLVHYGYLKSKWISLVEQQLTDSAHLSEQDKDYYRKETHVDRSIQHLCDAQVLFQGREWQCRKCYNRNWISIDAISRTLVCEICQSEKSAPVSGDWAFRLNDFVLEAYRDHGVEPVVWALWRLSERARTSFYFAPSMSLWDDYPENTDGPTAEIDALVAVDGVLYLVEAKASARLSAHEMKNLMEVCERVRPDVLLIALMEATPSASFDRRLDGLQRLMPRTKVEVLRFDTSDLEDGSMLPH
jgi:hypothetical protein